MVERNELWEDILTYLAERNKPYLILSGMKVILHQQDKTQVSLVTHCQVAAFQKFTIKGLTDLGYEGPAYTWTNRRSIHFHIKETLDRVFANSNWSIL